MLHFKPNIWSFRILEKRRKKQQQHRNLNRTHPLAISGYVNIFVVGIRFVAYLHILQRYTVRKMLMFTLVRMPLRLSCLASKVPEPNRKMWLSHKTIKFIWYVSVCLCTCFVCICMHVCVAEWAPNCWDTKSTKHTNK